MSAQWIHSKVIYLRNLLSKQDEELSYLQAEVIKLEAELKKLGASPTSMFVNIDADFLKNWEEKLGSKIDSLAAKHLSGVSNWNVLHKYLWGGVFLMATILLMFGRSDFLSFGLAALVLYYEVAEAWNGKRYRTVCLVALVCLLQHLYWILLSPAEQADIHGLHTLEEILSLLAVGLQALAAAVSLKISRSLSVT